MDERDPTYTRMTLERIKFGWQRFVSQELADTFAIEPRAEVYQELFGGMRFQVTQSIFAQHLDRAEARYPETWQDAVKAALYAWLAYHWPIASDYLTARSPVRERVISIEAKALYPQITVPGYTAYPTIIRNDWTE